MNAETGASGLTVLEVLHALLDLPAMYGDHPTRDALLQFTHDAETFYVIDWIEDLGDGGVCATLVPLHRHLDPDELYGVDGDEPEPVEGGDELIAHIDGNA